MRDFLIGNLRTPHSLGIPTNVKPLIVLTYFPGRKRQWREPTETKWVLNTSPFFDVALFFYVFHSSSDSEYVDNPVVNPRILDMCNTLGSCSPSPSKHPTFKVVGFVDPGFLFLLILSSTPSSMSKEEDCRLISQNVLGALPVSASFLYHKSCFLMFQLVFSNHPVVIRKNLFELWAWNVLVHLTWS